MRSSSQLRGLSAILGLLIGGGALSNPSNPAISRHLASMMPRFPRVSLPPSRKAEEGRTADDWQALSKAEDKRDRKAALRLVNRDRGAFRMVGEQS